jgi:PAS domain S-box-containing protein
LQHEVEERYRLLFDHMLDGFAYYEIILNGDGQAVDYRFLGLNDAFERLTGIQREDVLGKTVTQVLPEIREDNFDWIGVYGNVALTGQGVTFESYSSNQDRWYAISAHCPRRGYFATILQDISERKRAEKELEEYRERLEELVRERTRKLEEAQAELVRQARLSALGQLMAVVSHEVRNPLNTVRVALFSMGDIIRRGDEERARRTLDLAERNIVRCNNIISELLDYTRCRTLDRQLTRVDVWLDAVLNELQSPLMGQVIPGDIVCARDLNSGAQLAIDREHLRRAVVNVVQNAVHALEDATLGQAQDDESNDEESQKRLSVSTRVVRDGELFRLEIIVSDTGPGIPGDELEKVFEPFFSTKSFGVGLGLPIVASILEQHGGGVSIESQVGQGTGVTLWLPVEGGGQESGELGTGAR